VVKAIHQTPEIPQEYIKWFTGGFPRDLLVRGIFSACEAAEYADLSRQYPSITSLPFAHFTARPSRYSKQFAPSNPHGIPFATNNTTVDVPFMDINTDDFGLCVEALLTASLLVAKALPGRGVVAEIFAEKTEGLLAIGASLCNRKAAAISLNHLPGMITTTVLVRRGLSMSTQEVK
jgi:hypothetical protein